MLKIFGSSIAFTVFGLILSGGVGWYYGHTFHACLNAVFITTVLALLEVSISFDNAVVNATVLKDMTPLWQRRFLTWGMAIAVFGMRLVFPLLIVGIVAAVGPWEALNLALFKPQEYAAMMLSVHHEVAAFGGAFLMLVALKYFFNAEKEHHWIRIIEEPLVKLGKLESAEMGIVILFLIFLSRKIDGAHQVSFLISGLAGIITFLLVEGLGALLDGSTEKQEGDTHKANTAEQLHRASLGMFLYLEVLDASFSFDGVVGAFAITNNLFIITIGLGIGAMFVRSLTILLVQKGTLQSLQYLEHGAFYAVYALAVIMFINTIIDVPEWITGLVGMTFIGLSIWSSLRARPSKALS